MTGTNASGAQGYDFEVSSQFADRPVLKAIHKRFPAGPPIEDDAPLPPTHEAMMQITYDRRVMEDPDLSGTMQARLTGKLLPQQQSQG